VDGVTVLAWAVVVLSVGTLGLGLVYVAKGVRADLLLLGVLAVALLAWLLQALGALFLQIGGTGPDDSLLFWGYMLSGVAVPVGAAYFAVAEPTRTGAIVVTVAGLVLAVLEVRVSQIWPLVGLTGAGA
jgi:hypothetical protein